MYVRLVLIAAMTGSLLADCSDSSSRKPTTPSEPPQLELLQYSQIVVKKVLKSPSSTSFPQIVFSSEEYTVTEFDDKAYMIKSWGEAKNAFGATLREKWTLVIVPKYRDGRFVGAERIIHLSVGDEVAVDKRSAYAKRR